MAVLFPLALPATGLLGVGWIRMVRDALRGDDLRRRLALSSLAVPPPLLMAFLVNINLRWPFWSFGKAFYALFLTPTLALLGVLGFDALDSLLRKAPVPVRALSYGWATAFFGRRGPCVWRLGHSCATRREDEATERAGASSVIAAFPVAVGRKWIHSCIRGVRDL
jgi:hypothetical protein